MRKHDQIDYGPPLKSILNASNHLCPIRVDIKCHGIAPILVHSWECSEVH